MDPLDQLRQHYSGLWLREERASGQVYVGRDVTGAEATIVVLSEQSATDPGLRNLFADVVWRHSVGSEPGQASVYAADLHAARPWAATRGAAGQPGAEQLLTEFGGMAPPPASPSMSPPMPPSVSPSMPPPMSPSMGSPQPFGPPSPAGPGFGPPPGAPGGYPPPAAPPARSGPPWPLIGILGGALVVMLIAVGTVVGIQVLGDNDDQTLPTAPPPPPQTGGPTEEPNPTEGPSASPDPGGGGGEPELRDAELVSVIGPNFSPNEDTFTMSFPGWPFAFRAPGHWNCLKGDFDPIPEAEVWGCNGAAEEQRANVLLWECPTTCTENEQADMLEDWLDDPDDARQAGSTPTYYVEYERNANDKYGVDLGHFFGAEQAGEPRWMVGVYVESPPDTKDTVLKILNDIVSQAG
jgi:hypothetical protein